MKTLRIRKKLKFLFNTSIQTDSVRNQFWLVL